jgi:hypothetical protein
VLDVAATAPNRLAILLKLGPASYYDSRIVVSANGGKTWDVVEIPHTTISSLSSANGEFWVSGTEVIDRDKIGGDGFKGGHAVPMLMHSANGKDWLSSPRPAKTLFACKSEGCLAFDGTWINPFEATPKVRAYSPSPSASLNWATSKETFCLVSAIVMCTETVQQATVPVEGKALPTSLTKASFEQSREKPPICIRCPIEQYYVDKDFGGMFTVSIIASVKTNGTVERVDIRDAPNENIRQEISESVKRWIFQPVVVMGVPVTAEKKVSAKIAVIKPR